MISEGIGANGTGVVLDGAHDRKIEESGDLAAVAVDAAGSVAADFGEESSAAESVLSVTKFVKDTDVGQLIDVAKEFTTEND